MTEEDKRKVDFIYIAQVYEKMCALDLEFFTVTSIENITGSTDIHFNIYVMEKLVESTLCKWRKCI